MSQPKDVYLMGICGTGMGALAGLLQAQGYLVRGSDEHVYPPMSDKLRDWGIEVLEGYDASHLHPAPDLVVVGNVIRRHNPEATYAREHQLPMLSMPQAVAELGIGQKHSLVVAGTHGKTTTSALAAHTLLHAGLDPSFLVGGVLVGYPDSFRAGTGDVFVVEGDEYDTAYFDKGPKFVHYRPTTAILTSLEFDHADIYASVEAIEAAFASLIRLVPAAGHLVVWGRAERALRLVREHGVAKVTVYDDEPGEHVTLLARDVRSGPDGTTFEVLERGVSLGVMRVPLWGRFGVHNALAVVAALRGLGLEPAAIAAGLATFGGVKRRLEVLGEPGGVTVVDDFGHHPTAIRETLGGARSRWPNRRVWAVFEPRSATSRRNVLQAEFAAAFRGADRVVLGSHERLGEVPEAERFDPARVARELTDAGVPAAFVPRVADIVQLLRHEARAGDVILVFSNGSFDGLHGQLLAALPPA